MARKRFLKKHPHFKWLVLAFFVLVILLSVWVSYTNRPPGKEPIWGITYSSVYAESLGLESREVYTALLEDLNIKYIRLPIYWSEVERDQNEYDFEEYDWLIEESEKYGAKLTVVVGQKVPRWPECFIPDWAEELHEDAYQQQLLEFIALAVNRYKDFEAVIRWQVENEPFFPFGECPKPDLELFNKEIALVKSLDSRPIQLTVSGELDPWFDTAYQADVLGTSLYRITYNKYLGFFYYPLAPSFYSSRVASVDPFVDKVVISELQTEPWFPEPIESRQPQDWYEVFDEDLFRQNVEFAHLTNVDEAYLWGAEWWYLLKVNGEDRLWKVAEEVFNDK